MSTICYDLNHAHHPPAGVPSKQRPTSAESKTGNLLGSQLLEGSSRHESDGASSECDVSDDDLITAAQRDDQNAFAELCRRHSAVAKKKIFNTVRNHEDAEDVLHDTLLRAYTHLTSFRRSCIFSTWLTTIGVNSALMRLRKGRARGETYASRSNINKGTVESQEFEDRSQDPKGSI